MVNNNNSNTTRELVEAGKLQVIQGVPQTIANYIQPVIEVNPKLLRRCDIVRSASTGTTSATIYTTPTDRDFYLVAATIAVIKDAGSQSTGTNLRCYVEGVNQIVMNIPGITLTAQSETMVIAFPVPIRVDRNTAITVNASSAVAVILSSGTIIGYVVDNSNA